MTYAAKHARLREARAQDEYQRGVARFGLAALFAPYLRRREPELRIPEQRDPVD